jgi:predicted RND superfamily exporter protein
MKKFTAFIVDKQKIFLIVFALLAAAGGALFPFVNVNYDMAMYMPKDSETARGTEALFKEFGNCGAMTAMLENTTLKDAYAVKKEIEAVAGVKCVVWLDTLLLPYKESFAKGLTDEEFMDAALGFLEYPELIEFTAPEFAEQAEKLVAALSQFYKDDSALFQITFEGEAHVKTTTRAIENIKDIADFRLSGQAANTYAMQSAIKTEIGTAVAIIAPAVLIILLLSTTSYFDPVVLITVIAVSVLLNIGSHYFLGSISYLTNSICILLQVAVTMDYAIFFLHSYKAERRRGFSPSESSKSALKQSFIPVTASSLTTVAGFCALMFMRYAIGFDMGFAMAKGVVLSLITVYFFMPGFVVATDRAITKLEHPSLIALIKSKKRQKINAETEIEVDEIQTEQKKPSFGERFASSLIKAKWVLPIIFLALIVPAYLGQSNNDFRYGELASTGGMGSTLDLDLKATEKVFGSQNKGIILLNKDLGYKEFSLTEKLNEIVIDGKNFVSAQSFSLLSQEGELPDFMRDNFVSESYTRIILTIDGGEESSESFKAAEEIRRVAATELGDGNYYILGGTLSTQELREVNKRDYTVASVLTLVFIATILFFSTKSFVLTLTLCAVIQGAIWINMAIPYILKQPIVFLGYLIISCIQMGATIDYGILLSSHYTSYRKEMDKTEAAKRAFLSSVGPMTTSAAILTAVGLSVGLGSSNPTVASIGMFLGRGAIISLLLMVFLLPQCLVILDKAVYATMLDTEKLKRRVFSRSPIEGTKT